MRFSNYDEMREFVLANSNDVEKARVIEEDALFRERGWTKYILAIGNYFSDERKQECLFFGGSARDSYMLYKVSFPNSTSKDLLESETAKQILFNDALRLRLRYVYIDMFLQRELLELQKKLDKMTYELGLKYREKLISKNRERIVIYENSIPDEDFDIINSETRNSSEDVNDILRKYFIVVLEAFVGL